MNSANSIPAYLGDLDLPRVFSAYSPSIGQFIIESTNNEHVVDSNTQHICGFVTASFGQYEDAAQKYFSVDNPARKPFSLIQIDHGIIQSASIQKCDCAIANEKNLCFVEFKANAYSKRKKILEKNYVLAMNQLTATISLFDSFLLPQGVDIRLTRKVEAFICFRHGYPRRTSSQINFQVAFAKNNRGIPLSFARSTEF